MEPVTPRNDALHTSSSMLTVSLRNLLITFSSLCLSSVLNHCEVHRVAAVVYQCYSDVIGPDSVTMETYKPALTHLGKSVQVSCFSVRPRGLWKGQSRQKEEESRCSALVKSTRRMQVAQSTFKLFKSGVWDFFHVKEHWLPSSTYQSSSHNAD